MTPQEAIAELTNRGIVSTDESVLAEEGTTFEEFKKGAESVLKGGAVGIASLVTIPGIVWSKVYDKFNKNKEPFPISAAGIGKAIKDVGGPDIFSISGYKGLHTAAAAAVPAITLSGLGIPGLFGRTASGLAGEAGVTGLAAVGAEAVAPDSPLAQFMLQTSPYAVKGSIGSLQKAYAKPNVNFPDAQETSSLLQVGRMTPGELTGSRPQLAKEAATEINPKIEETANLFRQAQAQDVNTFLTKVINRSASKARTTGEASDAAINAFDNYGKVLSGKLKRDAASDFNAAKAYKGTVSTKPVLDAVAEMEARLSPEVLGDAAKLAVLQKIKSQYIIPEILTKTEPSIILGPTGKPAFIKIIEGTPAGRTEIDIANLQRNLATWGEAAYSGKANFGNSVIFEGVAPGIAKEMSLNILRGFRKSLDEASTQGIPGAEKLVKARDSFKNNLNKIEEYNSRPLVKYFDKDPAALIPEDVLTKLKKIEPSERIFLAHVLENHAKGSIILDTVRKSTLEDMLNKAKTSSAGAAAGDPTMNIKTLLRELNNKKGDFNYLFPKPTDAADATQAITWMQKVGKTSAEQTKKAGADIYGATRGIGSSSQSSFLLSEGAALIKELLNSPKIMAEMMFDKEVINGLIKAQKAGSIKKTFNILKNVGEKASVTAIRAGPRIDTSEPTLPQEDTGNITSMSPEEALQALREKGIQVN